MKDKLKNMRRDYKLSELNEESVEKNPFEQFSIWFQEMLNAEFYDPTAFIISTCTNNRPSSRVVLLKSYDENGFVFFTNYNSRKGKALEDNPLASMLFYWDKLERQIRIEGKVSKLSIEESEEYYNSRPYESRIAAYASKQSRKVNYKEELTDRFIRYTNEYPENPPLPEFWGGYRVIPEYFEFWQGRSNRMHDRIVYEKANIGKWEIKRLFP